MRPPFFAQITALILLFIGIAVDGRPAQIVIDPERQEQFADHLFDNGQYRRAGQEYQRLSFFFGDRPRGRSLHFKAGRSLW